MCVNAVTEMKHTVVFYVFVSHALQSVYPYVPDSKRLYPGFIKKANERIAKIWREKYSLKNLKVINIVFVLSNLTNGDSFLERVNVKAKAMDVRGIIVNNLSNNTIVGSIEGTNKTLLAMKSWMEIDSGPGSVMVVEQLKALRFYQYDELTIYVENTLTVTDIGVEELLMPIEDDDTWNVDKDNVWGISANTRRNCKTRHATNIPLEWVMTPGITTY